MSRTQRRGRGARGRDLLLGVAAAGATGAVWRRLRTRPVPGGRDRWARTNHAGEDVTLLEGVALVAGATGAAVLAGPLVGVPPTRSAALALTGLGAGWVGGVDDLRQDTDRKGLAGHLGALAHGRVTTGSLKILVLAGTGVVGTALVDRTGHGGRPQGEGAARRPAGAAGRTLWSILVGGAVVAGSANLANLLDLRPGRALKTGLLTAVPLVLTGPGAPAAAVVAGGAAVLLPDDLAGRSMLGDTGANPLGALVGLALVDRWRGPGRALALGVITGLTLVSEKVSFTAVIESTPVLRELDALGRARR